MFNLFKKEDTNKVSELDSIIKKIKLDTNYFEKVPDKFKINKSVISTLLKKDDFSFKKLSKKDRNNKKLYQTIVLLKKDGSLLKYAGDDIKKDFNSILLSVYFNPCSIDYVKNIEYKSTLELDELLFWLIKKDERLFNFINKDILSLNDITLEKLKNLQLDISEIQKKYDNKLGINSELHSKNKIINKNSEKLKLSTILKN